MDARILALPGERDGDRVVQQRREQLAQALLGRRDAQPTNGDAVDRRIAGQPPVGHGVRDAVQHRERAEQRGDHADDDSPGGGSALLPGGGSG